MPRVHYVKKARKEQNPCYKCGKKIKKGAAYRWWANRMGRISLRRVVCMACRVRNTDLSSSKLAVVHDAMEDATEQITDAAGVIQAALENLAETVEDVATEYRDSVANMPESLQESPTAEGCNEKADELESFMESLQNWDESQSPEDARNLIEEFSL